MGAEKHERIEKEVLRPYSLLFNPHMTWFDVFLMIILPFIIPLDKMLKFLPTEKTEEATENAKGIRKKYSASMTPQIKQLIARWSACARCPISQYSCRLRIQSDVLQRWGIVGDLELPSSPQDEVSILVRFPSYLLTTEATNGEAENGCIIVESLDLESFAPEVPIMVHFHGGGFTIGVSDDANILGEFVDLAEASVKQNGPENER